MKSTARYVVISPCRNEAQYARQSLESVVNQTVRPTKWVIVDDGSSDATPQILAEYAQRYDWIEVVTRSDRGRRAVGPGVIPMCAQISRLKRTIDDRYGSGLFSMTYMVVSSYRR